LAGTEKRDAVDVSSKFGKAKAIRSSPPGLLTGHKIRGVIIDVAMLS
jgi:hypothetical protein